MPSSPSSTPFLVTGSERERGCSGQTDLTSRETEETPIPLSLMLRDGSTVVLRPDPPNFAAKQKDHTDISPREEVWSEEEISNLFHFSKVLGMSVEGHEVEILNLLEKLKLRTGNSTLCKRRKKKKSCTTRFERELKRLECSVSYGETSGEKKVDQGCGKEPKTRFGLPFGDEGVRQEVSCSSGTTESWRTWSEKEDFWEELSAIRGLWEDPWCLGGDFNAVRFPEERRNSLRLTIEMRRFSEVIGELGLKDLPLAGGPFTWIGGLNSQAASRLDRFLFSDQWEDHFSAITQAALPRLISDHSPIVLQAGRFSSGKSPFRFENMWLKIDGFQDLVRSWWNGCSVEGSSSHCIAEKLKALKKDLKNWNKEVIGNVSLNRAEAFSRLQRWETRQKSREIWLKEGDKNTKYFHKMANARARKNFLSKIRINEVTLSSSDDLKEGVCRAYKSLLSEPGDWRPNINGLNFKELGEGLASSLEVVFSEEEIYAALSSCCGDKTPGPGRLNNGLLRSLNSTFLLLIPKKEGAEDLRDFRPISLIGSVYKLLAKVLANRLKSVMGEVISDSQQAFVHGRQILDAVLIANKALDSRLKDNVPGLLLKLDIEKAFDHVNWNFLIDVMSRMGFGHKWINWMKWCWFTATFSILINGCPTGFFRSSRGLRQGDPLSPYLFLFAMEALSQLLSRARNEGFFSGFKVGGRGREGLIVSHLLFADDTLIFCNADAVQLQYLSWTFMWFEAISGLKVNLSKSEAIPVGECPPMESLVSILGCKIGCLPTSYLGLPLGAPYKSTSAWDAVEERFRKRLSLWKRQYLSKGGRLTLLKSTLSSLPTYFLSLFVIPKRVCARLEKIQRDFLWGGGALENKPHLVCWKVICAAKKDGGLGIRNLAIFNKALLGKWLWRFANENESLWKQIISSKYDLQDGGWCSKGVRDRYGVGVWKAIRNGWENFRSHSRFLVGDGTRVKFWKDLWCENQSLEEAFPILFNLSVNKEGLVAEAWEEDGAGGSWGPRFNRHLNDWKVGEVENLLSKLHPLAIRRGVDDSLRWKANKNGTFSVKCFYSSLSMGINHPFPANTIWTSWAPTRASFFGWEAAWNRLLTIDRLKRFGWNIPNRCFLCKNEESSIDHLLLFCEKARMLWYLTFSLFGVQWVMHSSVKRNLLGWYGSFVGKKREKAWKTVPLCLMWTIWK
ncbi:putative ribonuclease H protein [Vitis vinifera]|uniref:Putative ribonuclease H protein n=1 Tax=Vitis vinifera TaxID=29760 RepID=A0A438ISY3_VITVI|nr:putative ribonuclease H protein [Vitis vinifera]